MARRDRILSLHLLLGRVLYRLKVEDAENIPAQGACIIAFNHIAPFVDGLTLAISLRRRPDSAAFGGHRLLARSLQRRRRTRRSQGGQSRSVLAAFKARGLSAGELLKALGFLRQGRAIILAPEGETTWHGRLQHPLAPGAAWMALRAHVPVVPVVSVGGYDIHPRWAQRPKLTGRVTIRAGTPLYVSDGPATRVTDEMVAEASQRIYDHMAALIAR
jgi:1-acyl-sn-glycerol-3-phosphate acyltransferase